MLLQHTADLLEVHLGDRRVRRPAARDQDVVDRCGQLAEEPAQTRGVAQVEGGGGCSELLTRRVEPLRVAAGDDEFRVGRACLACRFQADARAAADDHDRASREIVHCSSLRGPVRREPVARGRRPSSQDRGATRTLAPVILTGLPSSRERSQDREGSRRLVCAPPAPVGSRRPFLHGARCPPRHDQ
ncbi:hypothetical protein AS200_01975 [Streptomyces sp. CdTB01]|nr:hypothetical protein AS200_01975 [Streptomyces sp. CdTB01]